MATEQQPERDPIDDEIERVLADDPGLLERLQAVDRKRKKADLKTLPHKEALRRLGIDR